MGGLRHNQDIVFVVAEDQIPGNRVIDGNIAQGVDLAVQRDAGDVIEPLQLHSCPAGIPKVQLAMTVKIGHFRFLRLQKAAHGSHQVVFQLFVGVLQPVGTGRIGHHHFGGILAVSVRDDGSGNDHVRGISARILTADGNRLQSFLYKLAQNAVYLFIRLALYRVDKLIIDVFGIAAEGLQHLLYLFRKKLIICRLIFTFEINAEIDSILQIFQHLNSAFRQ